MTDQQRPFDAEVFQQLRQCLQRFAMHEVGAVAARPRARAAVAAARVDDRRQGGRHCDLVREVAPLADGAQALVQEDERRAGLGAGDAADFQAHGIELDEVRGHATSSLTDPSRRGAAHRTSG
jgi:hypothetical protein